MILFLISFISPYQRGFSQSNHQSGISSYLSSLSPSLDSQHIMWSGNTQSEDFLETRSGKLPEFHRLSSGAASFMTPPKNPHFTTTATLVRLNEFPSKSTNFNIILNFSIE